MPGSFSSLRRSHALMVMSGPIPAGSPDVSARGFAIRQRFSIIAAPRNDIRSSRLRVPPAGTISTLPRIFRQTSFPGSLFSWAYQPWSGPLRTTQPSPRPVLSVRAGQMANRRVVEQLTKRRRYVGRGLGHGLLYCCVLHRLEECIRLGAGLYAGAQRLGFLFSCFDGVRCGPPRDDQHDRLHLVREALGVWLFVATFFLHGLH